MILSCPKITIFFLLVVVISSCLTLSPSPVIAEEIRLGAAAVKITPPLGTPMARYYSRRDSEGVLDDLYAKAVVLDDGKTKAAMVACDLIGLPRVVVVEARRIIVEKTKARVNY